MTCMAAGQAVFEALPLFRCVSRSGISSKWSAAMALNHCPKGKGGKQEGILLCSGLNEPENRPHWYSGCRGSNELWRLIQGVAKSSQGNRKVLRMKACKVRQEAQVQSPLKPPGAWRTADNQSETFRFFCDSCPDAVADACIPTVSGTFNSHNWTPTRSSILAAMAADVVISLKSDVSKSLQPFSVTSYLDH